MAEQNIPKPFEIDLEKVKKLQSGIRVIGLLDFVEENEKDKFLKKINQYSKKEVSLSSRPETHPTFVTTDVGPIYEIDLEKLPQEAEHLFSSIRFFIIQQVPEMFSVSFWGILDKEAIKNRIEETMGEVNTEEDYLELIKSAIRGRKQIKNTQKELSSYLEEIIPMGLFSRNKDSWRREESQINYPSFWSYNLAEKSKIRKVDKFIRENKFTLNLLGGNQYLNPDQVFEMGERGFITDSLENYWTELRGIDFRVTLFDLHKEALHRGGNKVGEKDLSRYEMNLAINLAKLYAWIAWSLKSYSILQDYNPRGESEEKLINNYYELRREYQKDIRPVFEGIHTRFEKLFERKTLLDENNNLVTSKIASTAQKIEEIFEKDRESLEKEYRDRIEERKTKVSLKSTREMKKSTKKIKWLTWVLVGLTILLLLDSLGIIGFIIPFLRNIF